ncbi:MFS transporter [Pantoea sp. B65]|uniref:MFS transporter n=1 Tax=Pantoea sp. B65 TaxID=2813359 RepID=UPI0039B43A9B
MNSSHIARTQQPAIRLVHHITLVIGLVCVGIGQTLLYTILGPASRIIGISEFGVGIIVTTAALIITLCSGLWGKIIFRVGSRNAYLSGMIFYAVGTLSLALALKFCLNHIISATTAFLMLLLIRCLTGALTAGIHPAAMTYISETTSKIERGPGMALIASAYSIGAVIGPLLGSSLGSVSIALPLYIAAGMAFFGTLAGYFILKPETKREKEKTKKKNAIKITDRRVFPVFIGISCTYMAFSAFQQTISFYIQDVYSLKEDIAIKQTGITVSLMALMMILIQLFYIQIMKPDTKKLLHIGSALTMLGFLLLIFSREHIVTSYFSAGLLGAGFGMMIPAMQSSASLAVSKEEQGGVAGFLFGASAFGYVIGPVLGTLIYSSSPIYLFSIGIVTIFIAMFFARKSIN